MGTSWIIVVNRPIGGTPTEYELGPYKWLGWAKIISRYTVTILPLSATYIKRKI